MSGWEIPGAREVADSLMTPASLSVMKVPFLALSTGNDSIIVN